MEPFYHVLLFSLGMLGGLLSGLVGIGGGIIMVPLLLYVPPLFGFPLLGMKVVAGMTTVQSFAGAMSGVIGHNKFKRVHPRLVLYVGLPMTIACFLGSRGSPNVPETVMLATFGAMSAAAALLMLLLPKRSIEDDDLEQLSFNPALAVTIGITIGAMSGVIGQGGAFLYIPALLYVLHIPTRIAIGSALAIGVLSSTGVLLGRLGTNQIPWADTLALVAGVIVGARLGSVLSQTVPREMLRRILSMLIVITTAKIGIDVVHTI
jgi:uncharacterized membrane protein YfcA